ncbi:hypothetical protein PFLUV_G00144130 [Perca fluviatilis]|uniref:Uncharacterized protein n=1 Tax=Perca fluviatilis TaxID=8168 RepID=A0A6A5F4T9_PERFL|nr:hypothetical protein PFLUV_G00144130 [Perca fluviatilis]
MTAFSGHTFLSEHGNSTDQVKELQNAIQESTRKLVEAQQKTLRAEEEIIQCTRETERRVDLMRENSGVVDALQHLGHLLQKERHLSEQLNGQASSDRNQRNDLQERCERVTNKARSLAVEILEVKEHLAEAKARNMAAHALIQAPTGKSKRNRSKPKLFES